MVTVDGWPGAGAGSGAGALLQLLRHDGPQTRATLALRTGLARSTVSGRVEALQATGLVTTAGEAVSTGGRPPSRLALNPRARAVVAVDLGATHVTVAATDLRGEVLAERSEALEVSRGPEPVLDRVLALARAVLADGDAQDLPLAGIGLGLPGPVEHDTGRPTSPPIMPGWDGFDVPGYVGRTLDTTVLVDNDVNVMAIGEQAVGWPHVAHLLFVKVATGIGAGIISDGRINRGAQGTAGDLGHVQVPGGPQWPCGCGNVGCLEAVAAGPALAQRLREAGRSVSDGEAVIDLARAGDTEAVRLLREAGREIGGVLATCVSLLNPSVIVLGGRMAAVGEYLLAGVREVVYRRTLPLAAHQLHIATAKTGSHAGVLGAAAMVVDAVLSPEAIDREVVQSASGPPERRVRANQGADGEHSDAVMLSTPRQ